MKKKYHIIKNIIINFICLLFLIGALGFNWILKTWNGLTMDEVVFHLKAPLDGTNNDMIIEVIFTCILPSILIVIALNVLSSYLHKKSRKLVIVSVTRIIICVFFVISSVRFWIKLDVGAYLNAQNTDSKFIEQEYVNPSDVDITFPDKKRNLIYIFLESMETTYADKMSGGAFEENYISELTKLAKENEDFSGEEDILNGCYTMPKTTWTMGALFAQTSGLPLQIGIGGNGMSTQEEFFSDMVTLGDVLKNEGYTQTFMIGSEAEFGGRKLYFEEHGLYNIMDYDYATENEMIPKGYKVFWGYEDKKLFSFAKEKITELASGESPFNFTMLTVDTHFEDGYVCEECDTKYGDNQYANVMACSSSQINQFVEWIQQQDFYENTTVVLVGDHLTMDSDFCENIEEDYSRKTYTCYINSVNNVQDKKWVRNYTVFDMFPTTLAALGGEIEGNRLGLGTNLFSEKQTLIEEYGFDYVKNELEKKSVFMEKLANINLRTSKHLKNSFNGFIAEYKADKMILSISTSKRKDIDGFKRLEIDISQFDNSKKMKTIAFESNNGSFQVDIDLSDFNCTNVDAAIYMVDSEEKRFLITNLQRDISLCINDINLYLEELKKKENISIFITIMHGVNDIQNDEIQSKIMNLGLNKRFIGQGKCSYYAVIDNGKILAQEIGNDKSIEKEGKLKNGNEYKIVSAGNTCSVMINKTEYAIKDRGLNIVVYDNEADCVLDTVCIDTYEGIKITRPYGIYQDLNLK